MPGQSGDTREGASLRAALRVIDLLAEKPSACIGFPTGRTPTRMYEILREESGGSGHFLEAHCFALDDYVDAPVDASFQNYLQSNLYDHVGVPAANRHNPSFTDDYDALIRSKGGLDLVILGVGRNGHVAFNEPGTPSSSWTHSLWLTEETRLANSQFFASLDQVPTKAVTMGISTLLASRSIIVMAFGAGKKAVLEEAMQSPDNPLLPVSFLTSHPDISLYSDFASNFPAAAEL